MIKINIISNLEKKRDRYLALFSFLLFFLLPICILSVLTAPSDYLQEDISRIMYIHVPCAWIALGIYFYIGLFSILFLVYKNIQLYILSKSLAPIGLLYCTLALITGSIWGIPTWGTWWAWDARLTSMLLLWFIYAGYIILDSNYPEESGAKILSYYAVVGLINLPIIKFSVNIWSTLHQDSSVFRLDGPTIHPDMLYILAYNVLLHGSIVMILLVINVNICIITKKYLNSVKLHTK